MHRICAYSHHSPIALMLERSFSIHQHKHMFLTSYHWSHMKISPLSSFHMALSRCRATSCLFICAQKPSFSFYLGHADTTSSAFQRDVSVIDIIRTELFALGYLTDFLGAGLMTTPGGKTRSNDFDPHFTIRSKS